MLLKRLTDYAEQHCPDSAPFHREREFVWQLELFRDGTSARLRSLRSPDERGKNRGIRLSAPTATRTRQAAANLGADRVQDVFGWGDESTKPKRVAECHEAFTDLIQRWADELGADSDAAVVADFYARGGVDALSPPDKFSAKDGVVIAVDGQRLIEHPGRVAFWANEVTARKGAGSSGVCLVCGTQAPLIETMPGTVPKNLVPGAGNDAALISVNKQVFGYRLEVGLSHTPICFPCGNAVNTGLTRLLSGTHVSPMAGQDSVMTWWTLGTPHHDVLSAMPDEADPNAVTHLLDRLRTGELARAADQAPGFCPDRFCSVSLGGSASRIMIRDWIDMPLPQCVLHLAQWWDDVQILQPGHDRPTGFGLWRLILATGRWQRDDRKGRYVPLGSKSEQRPENIHRDLVHCSLHHTALPAAVLRHVLHRIATDAHIDAPRAALVRLGLRRHPTRRSDMTAGLDDTNTDTAYVSGRIFAHMERIQYFANNPPNDNKPKKTDTNNDNDNGQGAQLNAGFRDRFLSGAISRPASALAAGDKLVPAWLRRIQRTAPGLAASLEKDLAQLRAKIDLSNPLPLSLLVDQQGRFVLGYYHEKAHQIERSEQRRAERN